MDIEVYSEVNLERKMFEHLVEVTKDGLNQEVIEGEDAVKPIEMVVDYVMFAYKELTEIYVKAIDVDMQEIWVKVVDNEVESDTEFYLKGEEGLVDYMLTMGKWLVKTREGRLN